MTIAGLVGRGARVGSDPLGGRRLPPARPGQDAEAVPRESRRSRSSTRSCRSSSSASSSSTRWSTENKIDALVPDPAVTIKVTGFQWGWSFQYLNSAGKQIALGGDRPGQACRCSPGTRSRRSTRGSSCLSARRPRIVLVSTDVVHTFYIPAFNFGRYALPGVTNNFDFTPVKLGVYPGHCAQYCGLYHSEMLFSVAVVSPSAFQTWLKRPGRRARERPHDPSRRPAVRSSRRAPEPEHEHGPVGVPQVDHLDRPQGDRQELHDHCGRLLPPGRRAWRC